MRIPQAALSIDGAGGFEILRYGILASGAEAEDTNCQVTELDL